MSRPVRISKEGRVVDADRAMRVRRSRHEDLEWVAQDGGGPWLIRFGKANNPAGVTPGSPFTTDVFSVDQGKSKCSEGGPVPGSVGNKYQYSVLNRDTEEVIDDPDVDVDP
jgi:hypothetical protein